MTDSPTRIDSDHWHRLPLHVREILTEWISAVLGRSILEPPHLFAAELGEGYLVTEEENGRIQDDEFLFDRIEYLAPSPPPCWPAPLPERFRP